MADDRRPARGGRPRGRTGPGRTPGAGRDGRARPRPAGARPGEPRGETRGPSRSAGRTTPSASRARLRPTGRMAVLALVLAVLAFPFASSVHAFLPLRSETAQMQEEIAERQANIDALSREIRRFRDPAFLEDQARRLGYVMPGETTYIVLDEDGEPLEPEATLSDPSEAEAEEPEAWWSDAWASVELAGDPPRAGDPVPLTEIDGSKEGSGE